MHHIYCLDITYCNMVSVALKLFLSKADHDSKKVIHFVIKLYVWVTISQVFCKCSQKTSLEYSYKD